MQESFDSMYVDEYLEVKDKYSYYLDGNHGLTEIISNSEGEGTLLIIKDNQMLTSTSRILFSFFNKFSQEYKFSQEFLDVLKKLEKECD